MNLMLSRRQALKTGVAGLVSASYCSPAAHANSTQLDMNKFCAAESTEKYELTRPWTSSGYCYATDRAICVRVMSLEPDTRLPANGQSYPPVSDLPWQELSQVARWKPWTKWSAQGAGEFPDYAVEVDTVFVQPCYDVLVRQLPSIHYAVVHSTSLGEVVLLRFQGGEGLLMTMKA